MEETKVETTEVTAPETKAEDLIPQEQVNGIVAKETKKAVEKLLKDLGVEDVKSAKDGLNKFKEMQEAQKTDLEKALEKATELETQLTEAQTNARKLKIERELDKVLTELEVDSKYASTILKLTDLSGVEEIEYDALKTVIETTINEELPMLVKSEKIKVGVEPQGNDKLPVGTNDYLSDKYKDNPYFKK